MYSNYFWVILEIRSFLLISWTYIFLIFYKNSADMTIESLQVNDIELMYCLWFKFLYANYFTTDETDAKSHILVETIANLHLTFVFYYKSLARNMFDTPIPSIVNIIQWTVKYIYWTAYRGRQTKEKLLPLFTKVTFKV